ncbi:23S rRNA (pseudouridine(1915)-N(3))-methyltransferase RlmH [Candidatus Woesearchaeota archaeon]|nr:23S rRNA (pseudouridine(1915)-N(3))-methyltransferase RlmH [Candidatus Woesearchaeota archaeon]
MLTIITVGKVKDQNCKQIIEMYKQRIEQQFTKLKTIEIREEKDKQKETENVLKHLNDSFIVVLDERGKLINSHELSKIINDKINNSVDIIFVIGNYYGITSEIKEKANLILSLSKMTFPHEIAQLVFVEQLYRTFSILKGLPYHRN